MRRFFSLTKSRQLQLLRKFYFELLPSLSSTRSNFNIDSNISNAFRNSKGLTMKKVIQNGDDRSEMTVSTVKDQDRIKKCLNLWEKFGYFGTETCDFSIEKANLPENSVFYINQACQSWKDDKKVYYTDVFILAQIMPLAHQPKDIENYLLK